MELIPGTTLGAYRLVERAGVGGMADVWRAYQASLDRWVALKILPQHYGAEPGFVERFAREAQIIARLDHPNILPVFDFGEQDRITFMAMPFIDGGTLADQLGPPWSIDRVLGILEPLTAALDYAHAQGVVHRDIKPSNVLIGRDGRVMLGDFGIARMLEGSTMLTQTGAVIGTPAYMSPEQAEGKLVGPPSDLYSTGVILYQLLTGRLPFQAETPMAMALAHMHQPLPLPSTVNPALSPGVEQVLLKALAKVPVDRYPSGDALHVALSTMERHAPASQPGQPALRDQPRYGAGVITLPGPGSDARGPIGRRRRSWALMVAALAATVLCASAVTWSLVGSMAPMPPPGEVVIVPSPVGASDVAVVAEQLRAATSAVRFTPQAASSLAAAESPALSPGSPTPLMTDVLALSPVATPLVAAAPALGSMLEARLEQLAGRLGEELARDDFGVSGGLYTPQSTDGSSVAYDQGALVLEFTRKVVSDPPNFATMASRPDSFENGIIDVQAQILSGSEHTNFSVQFRKALVGGSGYYLSILPLRSVIVLAKGRAQERVEIASVQLASLLVMDSHRLSVVADGPVIDVYVNGLLVLRANDSAVSKGQVGLGVGMGGGRVFGTSRVAYRNFHVVALR